MSSVTQSSPGNGDMPLSMPTKLLLLLFAYCMLGYLCLELTVAGKPASPLWPSSGVALAAVLMFGSRAWLVAFIGGVWITLVRDWVLLPALLSGLGAALEALAAAWMLRRLDFDTGMTRLRDAGILLGSAMLAACFSPSIGLTGYTMGGIAYWTDFMRSWYVWWIGDVLGMLIFVPFVLAWCNRPPYAKGWAGLAVLLLTYAGTLAIAASIFSPYLAILELTQETEFLLYPVLIWASLRFRLRDVATLLVLVALVSSFGTALGHGPFSLPNRYALDELAFFLIVTSVIVLAFYGHAATVMRANREQQQLNETLSGLIEAMPDAIFFKDGLGRWRLTNEPAKQLFHLHGYDWQGKTDREMAQERPEMQAQHEACIEGDETAWRAGKIALVSEFLTDAGGLEHEYEVRKVPIFQNDGRRKGMVIIGQDITARRKLERGLVKVTEYQQRSIGQDLHDNVGQRLVGIAFLAKVLEQNLRDRGLAEAQQVQALVAQVNEAIAETKNLARGLMPVELEANGLAAALDAYCARMASTYRLTCDFEWQGEVALQSQNLSLNLFRIAQEAVNNAIRHGRASEIHVCLCRHGADLELSVRDNGVGFAKAVEAPTPGMGMEVMRYRASLIGARLDILQQTRSGVEVRISVDRAY